jgi:hypothetical protein
MAPEIAANVLHDLEAGSTVLDPMMGSGTILAIGRAYGHKCIGFDVDPLAVLTAKVWTTTTDIALVRKRVGMCVDRARRRARSMSEERAYPPGADDETKTFIRDWFDGDNRIQLTALAKTIAEERSGHARNVMWCALSRLIIKKQSGASLARDVSHSRPHRAYVTAPLRAIESFEGASERVLQGCIVKKTGKVGPVARTLLGDARQLPIRDRSVDCVVTSPPYLNAIDYIRCSKFSLVWMQHTISSLRAIRASSIGTEVGHPANELTDAVLGHLLGEGQLPPRTRATVQRYVQDMHAAVGEISRVLRPGRPAVFVVGENTIRGSFLPTAEILSALAASLGLVVVARCERELDDRRRYLPPPVGTNTAMDARMRREVIITMERR